MQDQLNKYQETLLQVKEWMELSDPVKNGTHIRLIESVLPKAVKRSKVKFCDSCGNPFSEDPYPIINENHQVQKGLIQCQECYSEGFS